jgi:hypothetical protein
MSAAAVSGLGKEKDIVASFLQNMTEADSVFPVVMQKTLKDNKYGVKFTKVEEGKYRVREENEVAELAQNLKKTKNEADKSSGVRDKGAENKVFKEETKLIKQFVENIKPEIIWLPDNLSGLFAIIKEKLVESIKETQSIYRKQYNIRIKEDKMFPLEIVLKKVEGKIKVTLYSKGDLKEEIKLHLQELIAYLKKKDIDLFSIDVLEWVKEAYNNQEDGSKQDHPENGQNGEEEMFSLDLEEEK